MAAAAAATAELYDELAAADADFKTVFAEWDAFRKSVQGWHDINEYPMLAYSHEQLAAA